jgi:hypothetical protein
MGRWEIFHTFSLLVEIEGHFAHAFVNYVYETQERVPVYSVNAITGYLRIFCVD